MRPDQDQDAELARLLLAAISGDQPAYAVFLEGVAVLVRAYCRRRIGRGGVETEDVVQETLLAVHLKRATWRQGERVMPWVYTIARHKLVDAYRRAGRHLEVDIADYVETLAEPEKDAWDGRAISRALDGLAPVQRGVVSAISVEGLSIGETAEKLGMTETAVRVALHRGLKSIARRFLQD